MSFFNFGEIGWSPYTSQLASTSQQMWNSANNLLYPAENSLINYATNPNTIAQASRQAQTNADAVVATQQQNEQQRLGLMGVTPTAPQAAAIAKTNALGKAQAEAGAMNAAVQGARANQQAALTGV